MLVAERAEGLARLVGREDLIAEVELLVPELEGSLDARDALVPVRVEHRVLLRVGAEELAVFQRPVVVEMSLTLTLGHLLRGDLAEVLVALLLHDEVPLQDVVEAVRVHVGVGSETAAADGVLDEDVLLALASAEQHLGAVDLVAIAVVRVVLDVGIHDTFGVLRVPAVDDHEDGERLVAEANEAQALGDGIVDRRLEDSADLFLGERVGAVGGVVLPLVLFRHPLQKIEDARVVLVRKNKNVKMFTQK